MKGNGVLALWKDCAAGYESKFEHWYQTEHVFERLAIPGFLRCRRYRSVTAASHFFTWYEVTSADALRSKAYFDRLNDPTELTTEIMSDAMKNMSRTVCHRHVFSGHWFGAYAVTVKLATVSAINGNNPDSQEVTQFYQRIEPCLYTDSLARSELWTSAEETGAEETQASSTTREESLRGGDSKIETCLLLEFLREEPATGAAAQLQELFPAAHIGVYQLLCEQSA